MSDLTAKFEDLRAQLVAQHNTVVLKIGANTTQLSTDLTNVRTRLDTIIEKLDALNTTLIALRGDGPENTIRSINQSIWNMVGPAPGATLVDILSALSAANAYWSHGAGIRPYELVESISFALADNNTHNIAINGVVQKLVDTLGDPSTTYPQTYTVRYLLQLLLDQFATSVLTPTVKDILLTLEAQQAQLVAAAANPMNTIPAGVCQSPIVSTGSSYSSVTAATVEAYTVATWNEHPGGEFTVKYGLLSAAYTTISCTDWSLYRVYVASKSDVFGIGAYISPRRYQCNEWVTLSATGDLEFIVDGTNNLKVYICPVDAPQALAVCAGYEDLPRYGPFSFTPGTLDGEDTYKSYSSGVSVPGLTVVQATYYPSHNDVVEFFSSPTNIDCCVTLSGSCGYIAITHRSSSGEALYADEVLNFDMINESSSHTISLDSGVLYSLIATDIVGSFNFYITPQVAS